MTETALHLHRQQRRQTHPAGLAPVLQPRPRPDRTALRTGVRRVALAAAGRRQNACFGFGVSNPDKKEFVRMRLAELAGQYGQDWISWTEGGRGDEA